MEVKKTLRVAQISDCHLFGNEQQRLKKSINTTKNLRAVLNDIKREGHWDFLLLTGDLAEEGDPQAYQKLGLIIDEFQIPCYVLPGNHDNFNNLRTHLNGEYSFAKKKLIMGSWQYIFLNSTRPGSIEGHLSREELQFLKKCLEDHQDLFTVITLHHHPITSGSFMDEVMLTKPEELQDIIQKYKQIRAVLFGHIHQVIDVFQDHVLYLSAPATAYQIKPRVKKLIIDHLTPGYRWLEFEYNGNIKTGIFRLPMSEGNGTS